MSPFISTLMSLKNLSFQKMSRFSNIMSKFSQIYFWIHKSRAENSSDHHRGAKCTQIYEGTCQGSHLHLPKLFTSLTWLKESLFRVSSGYLQKVITSQGCQWEQCEAFRFYQSLFLRYEIEKGTESGLVGPRNQFFRILCSELIFRKLNESKVLNTGSVHHTLPADIQLTGIQLYWVKMSTKDTSFHSFFTFFSLLEKTETLDKKGDPHPKHRKNCETALFNVWIVENVFFR